MVSLLATGCGSCRSQRVANNYLIMSSNNNSFDLDYLNDLLGISIIKTDDKYIITSISDEYDDQGYYEFDLED